MFTCNRLPGSYEESGSQKAKLSASATVGKQVSVDKQRRGWPFFVQCGKQDAVILPILRSEAVRMGVSARVAILLNT